MFDRKIHLQIYSVGLCLLAFGIMIGNSPTSVSESLLLANWLVEGDFRRKWRQLKQNRIFWALVSVYILHLLGLFYTSDMHTALVDVRTKVPLILTPLIFFSSRALSETEMLRVLYSFIAGCFANTAWCLVYSFALHQNEVIRDASRFMSHIRLGMYLNLAICFCAYLVYRFRNPRLRICFSLLILYFIVVLLALGLLSGLAYLGILAVIGIALLIYRQNLFVKLGSLAVAIVVVALIAGYVSEIKSSQLALNPGPNNVIQEKSALGGTYIHFRGSQQKENGNYIFINIQIDELMHDWNKLCPQDSFSFEPPGYNLERYEILLRYLASKGLNKDSEGMSHLNENDRLQIRKGVSNYLYPSWSFLHKRIYETVNEYDDYLNDRHINGHSISMRFYFWRAAFKVIGDHLLFGVGTGDVQQALDQVYSTEGILKTEWYKRPHNQFLSITAAFGLVGLLVFMVSLIYPAYRLGRHLSVLYWPFVVVAVLSFFTEDTLETMAGMSFYAVWNTFFLAQAYLKKQQSPAD